MLPMLLCKCIHCIVFMLNCFFIILTMDGLSQTFAFTTRSSADADNRREAFSGQSRPTNMVPFWVRCDFSLSNRLHASPPRPPRRCKQRYRHAQHSAVRLNKLRPSVHLRSVAANCDRIFEFFHILARHFHETHGSLNFLTVHNCSQNLPLKSCVYA